MISLPCLNSFERNVIDTIRFLFGKGFRKKTPSPEPPSSSRVSQNNHGRKSVTRSGGWENARKFYGQIHTLCTFRLLCKHRPVQKHRPRKRRAQSRRKEKNTGGIVRSLPPLPAPHPLWWSFQETWGIDPLSIQGACAVRSRTRGSTTP
ncbi:hypothetical protein AVEN_43648-1 [Araneus ventricosus]|uniref:Uncharacterized protein n=1 Tax=Araneus ventricosus TaxID=182803 RepID=A0A4Y2FEB1_ARAVE|nr:hypothetical protein AVEN_43648-1 [Araneus ventricosus]